MHWRNRRIRYTIILWGTAVFITILLYYGLVALDWLTAWLIAINGLTFLAYGYDKTAAGSQLTRLPEATLLALAYSGGFVGALLGMRTFRHKTRKQSFQLKFWLVVGVQIALLAAYYLVRL